MATFTNLANDFSKKFIRAKNKKYVLNKIIYDVNYLVYSDTKEPLGYRIKTAILQHVFEVIAGRKPLILKEGENLSANFGDVVIFFERRSFILKQLKAGVKRQEELN